MTIGLVKHSQLRYSATLTSGSTNQPLPECSTKRTVLEERVCFLSPGTKNTTESTLESSAWGPGSLTVSLNYSELLLTNLSFKSTPLVLLEVLHSPFLPAPLQQPPPWLPHSCMLHPE